MRECIKRNKLLLILTIIFSIISSAAMVGLSLFIQTTIDYVTIGNMDGFKRILIYSVGYGILIGLLYFIYDILSKMFIRNLLKMLRNKVFFGILRRNYKDFNSKNTADYISVLTNDMKLIEENYVVPLLLILQYSVMFGVTVILLLYLSPLVTLGIFISMLLIFIVPSIFGKTLENKQLELSNRLSFFTSKLKDIFLGYDVIRSYNLRNNTTKEFQEENNNLANAKFTADKIFVINESISQILGLGTQFVAIFLSAYLVIKGELTMGMLIAIVQLSATFVQPVIMIMSNVPKLNSVKPIIKRIDDFSNYEDTDFVGKDKPYFNSNLEISNLYFNYGNEKPAIDNISLRIDRNKKYAIVGGSGCGKSTLVKLMLGYYSDFNGDIKFDGNSIKNLDIEQLNKMISIIHQNVYMFDKTIKDNICLYKEFSKEQINNVLNLSGANKFIEETTNGLNYLVGENGSNLSGGQRQRIAIARALIQQTPILVLDEGTSAIDMQTAYDIESKLLSVENLTLITITHKMSEELLSLYDEIIYMENGQILERGNLRELLDKKDKFFRFYTV
ncbi:ABC transporter ATP-binding protein [Clostridium botulinum]|uniref:Putative ABC transporter, ATP-binding protein/permease protein n=1 Tax=Clostridium botulinum (strain Langeland / NCTC 10281 / Type F) TaxID=441772 RepID=A7GB22_CLOBL|nr:ABC transporter ATP-binding protein [Clostridium botulinum]ABS40385.1 putative ABC transporter, ATP-binding protein/permease protein [Clostridium botulinum F str. Langeland]ADF98443.1 putative ABC transporter, ATP-binding protein/permease protein [Clostridium botulinum F str. 230613]KKM40266.1 ABC transporter permease [Clostridium botulinum]MBD5643980.1 ABC transporter ATP-binding protein [Clostridium botulinum]MBY6793445.1 ABC transporter ATP-binding protein [Clostridium botulinum]